MTSPDVFVILEILRYICIRFGVSAKNKDLRVKWCQDRLHWTYNDWLRTVWTDESTFTTVGFSHRPWVLRRPGEEFHPDCIDETWESGRESVMVWGGFCGEMKSELHIIPPKTKVNSSYYVTHVLDPILIPFWHQTCERYGWTQVGLLVSQIPGGLKHACIF